MFLFILRYVHDDGYVTDHHLLSLFLSWNERHISLGCMPDPER